MWVVGCFFSEQKTADEMRISDWSSDVCSSDLNRRITALRLLQTPALAAGTSLHKKFIELSKKYAAKPIEKVSCVVFDDKEEAFKWMERKHLRMDGRGLSQWGTDATALENAHRGQVRASKAALDRKSVGEETSVS